MATRAVKPKREDDLLAGWESMPERAPSVIKADTPAITRALAMGSLLLTAIGGIAMVAPSFGMRYVIAPGWGFAFFLVGVGGLLYHAFREQDVQFRRLYGLVGVFLIAVAIALRILPIGGGLGRLFLPYGIACLGVALFFLLAVIRNEEDQAPRNMLLLVLSVAGALQIAAGLIGGTISQNYLLGEGVILLFLGLLYVTSFIGLQSPGSPVGYRAGQILGAVGIGIFAIAFVRSILPAIILRFRDVPGAMEGYFIPAGLTLLGIGALYTLVALGICSDNQLVVLIRRELAAYFYSPIAYLILFGWTGLSFISYWMWLAELLRMLEGGRFGPGGSVPEPIVHDVFFSFVPVVGLIFVVPILTMRLLSEEHRTGTLEVLLTAAVNETTVVLSKFIAAFTFFLIMWAPTFMFLVAFRVLGGQPFEYRPLMSFMLSLVCTGASVLAMGLFFSSLTRNQIVAAVFTFIGMILHIVLFFARFWVGQAGVWRDVLDHMSMYHLWSDSLQGYVTPRYLIVHLSAAIIFVFFTIKILGARKWT